MITLHFHLLPQYKYELFHIYFTSLYFLPLLAAVIVLGVEVMFLLFVLLYSQRVSNYSCQTFQELLPDKGPFYKEVV